MDKVQLAMYLATVRLLVMENTHPTPPTGRHWINEEVCTGTILRYRDKGFEADAVAHAIVDAYRAVEHEIEAETAMGAAYGVGDRDRQAR